MTLFTSDKEFRRRQLYRQLFICLLCSVFCAVFGAVYEKFSHEVYAYSMLYAFLIPLAGDAVPLLWILLYAKKLPGSLAGGFYHAGIATLTVGAICTGVIEIYGTTNRLLKIYWIVGTILLAVGISCYLCSVFSKRNLPMKHVNHFLQTLFLLIMTVLLSLSCACENTEESAASTKPETTIPTSISTNAQHIETTVTEAASTELQVTFLSVGKADSIVLQTATHTVLIDCGTQKTGDNVADFLEAAGIETIDYLILTHYDQDHIGGAAEIIKTFSIGTIFAPAYVEYSEAYQNYYAAMEEKDLSAQRLTEDQNFVLDMVQFTVYAPKQVAYSQNSDNNFSLITSAICGETSFLFTGDAMEERLEEVMNIGTFDVLKIPYHGKEITNLDAFLEATCPNYAVISTAKDTLSENVTSLLKTYNITTYTTCSDGNIYMYSNGTEIWIETEKENT